MNFKKFHESRNLLNEAEPPQQIYVTTTATRYGYEVSLPSGTYTVSGGNRTTFTKEKVGTKYGTAMDLSISRTITLTDNGCILVYAQTADKFDAINVMLNTGSTPQPYEPYSSEVWHDIPYYQHKTATDTLTLPAVIYPNDTSITVGLKGNEEHTGTPTPQNPVVISGTGDMSGNLLEDVITGANIASNGSIAITPEYNIWIAKVTAGETYRASNVNGTYGFYTEKPTTSSVTYNSSRELFSGDSPTIEVPQGVSYIGIRATSTANNVMLNLGSTALPYEPYGYKIPVETSEDILVNNLTSQEHNGLTLTKNPDGSVRVQGTATANVNFCLYNNGHTLVTDAYQVIENGVYYIGGGIEGNEEGKFILSARYDDATGGAPSQLFRIPYGENIRIDNSNGEYKYLAVYIAVWKDQTVDFTCKPYLKAVSATNNIYLGEVQTTRKIKKLVLTGEETNWSATYWSNSFVFYDTIATTFPQPVSDIGICSHFKQRYGNVLSSGEFNVRFIPENNRIVIGFGKSEFANINDFKAYLAQQYATGTPVCVWYVLATPTTATVNEPLMKIGNYADSLTTSIPCTAGSNTLDVQTTVAPSEVTATFEGWHPVQSVHERENGQWD